VVTIDLYQINAFTDHAFAGNPAAVCPLAEWLPDQTMQAIARENGLSETAFFVRSGESYELRWFTPVVEVELCGHATLATAFALATYIDRGRALFEFETRFSGKLVVRRDDEVFTLDFPSRPVVERHDDLDRWSEVVGAPVREAHVAVKTMAVLADADAVAKAAPVMDRISELPGDGLIITAPGDDVDFVARYFAPHRGVPEDPVTGSAYCSLAPYWAERLGKRRLTARQLSRRGGSLVVEDRGARVLIAGRAVPYFVGRICI